MALSNLLQSYTEEAFRFEALPTYNIDSERESFEYFLKTGIALPMSELETFLQNQTRFINEGRRHIRARVIPEPRTDYFNFEMSVSYTPQNKNGFNLYFLNDYDLIALSNGKFLTQDFWLFDQKYLVLMEYESGRYLGSKLVNNEILLKQALSTRAYCLEHGKGIDFVR